MHTRSIVAILVLSLVACGGSTAASLTTSPDAEAVTPDAAVDAGSDTGSDAVVEANTPADVARLDVAVPDAGSDVQVAPVDAGTDASATDAAPLLGCPAMCGDAAVRISCNCTAEDACSADAGCVLP